MKILGKAEATAEQMAAYLLSKNPKPKIYMAVLDFCQLFLSIAAQEGVRGDALFAQSCKETANFKYGGTVIPEQNNYAGLGTINKCTMGACFKDEATGILAQAQHAKGYATKDALSMECVDPRYNLLVRYGKAGTAENWEDLGGKWAVPGYDTKKYASLDEANKACDSYGYQIVDILNSILKMPKTQKQEEAVMTTKIIALDAGHGMKTGGKRCLKAIDPNQTREWYLNDRIMDRVQDLLANYNCKTIRTDDTTGAKDISRSARCKTANNAKADIFISMHHNAGAHGGSAGGTVVFYYSSNTYRKTQATKLYNTLISRTGLIGNRSQKVIKKGYDVLTGTSMPAFLIENGFMDSTTDTPIILTAEHAEKTAQAVVSFLVNELSLEKKTGAGNGTQNAQTGTSSATTSTTNITANTYTVKSGDTLSKIGKKTGIAWKTIADINGIKPPYTIRVGQVLKLTNNYYPAYTGKTVTLSAALTSLGINSTYAFRKKIAVANGISGYRGSAAQNTQMYNLLKAGLLKKAE